MIIKDYGLADIQYVGDEFRFTHAQDIDNTLTEIKEIQAEGGDGYSLDRSFRHVGRIPAIEWVRHPEWNHAPELALLWLQTDEGKKYQVHKINTGRSGHIRVK